jgi:hypothetical protein
MYILSFTVGDGVFVLPVIKMRHMALLVAYVVGMRTWIRWRTQSPISLPTNRSLFALVKKADSIWSEACCDWSHWLDEMKVLHLEFTIWERTCYKECKLIL